VSFLRRALAVVLLLSVVSSTLGLAHARCASGNHEGTVAGGMAGMQHGAGHDSSMPAREHCDRGPGAPAEQGNGASCAFVAHCVAPMIAADRDDASSPSATSASSVTSPPSALASRALEPESPPPRA
jgi:hypothetical protein